MTKTKTKTSQPRKRAPGAGRPNAGRSAVLPRIRPWHKTLLVGIQKQLAINRGKPVTMAETVEYAVLAALLAVNQKETEP